MNIPIQVGCPTVDADFIRKASNQLAGRRFEFRPDDVICTDAFGFGTTSGSRTFRLRYSVTSICGPSEGQLTASVFVWNSSPPGWSEIWTFTRVGEYLVPLQLKDESGLLPGTNKDKAIAYNDEVVKAYQSVYTDLHQAADYLLRSRTP